MEVLTLEANRDIFTGHDCFITYLNKKARAIAIRGPRRQPVTLHALTGWRAQAYRLQLIDLFFFFFFFGIQFEGARGEGLQSQSCVELSAPGQHSCMCAGGARHGKVGPRRLNDRR